MTTATILVAHGSRDRRSAAVVRDIAAATGTVATFLDFDHPHPVEVLTGLADVGHRRATVVPLLLTRAFHGRVDIPEVVGRAEALRPALRVTVTAEVGGEALLPALKRPLPACDAIVLAAAGTRDIAALAAVSALADRLSRRTAVPCRAWPDTPRRRTRASARPSTAVAPRVPSEWRWRPISSRPAGSTTGCGASRWRTAPSRCPTRWVPARSWSR